MSWFHFNKQERLQRNRETRREQAETCRKEAGDNVFMIGRTVADAMKMANDEERTFEDYFGEPMPNHLQMALRLEVILWRRIQAALERADAAHMTEESYKEFAEKVRTVLLAIINLLHAEEEMLGTCLVRHYVNIIQAVQAEAASVTL